MVSSETKLVVYLLIRVVVKRIYSISKDPLPSQFKKNTHTLTHYSSSTCAIHLRASQENKL